MILSKTRITKALISLRGCAGWYAPLLFVNQRRQGFSRRGPYTVKHLKSVHSEEVIELESNTCMKQVLQEIIKLVHKCVLFSKSDVSQT